MICFPDTNKRLFPNREFHKIKNHSFLFDDCIWPQPPPNHLPSVLLSNMVTMATNTMLCWAAQEKASKAYEKTVTLAGYVELAGDTFEVVIA